jgi:hypothetical protein
VSAVVEPSISPLNGIIASRYSRETGHSERFSVGRDLVDALAHYTAVFAPCLGIESPGPGYRRRRSQLGFSPRINAGILPSGDSVGATAEAAKLVSCVYSGRAAPATIPGRKTETEIPQEKVSVI